MTRIPGNPPAGPGGPVGDLTTPPGPAELRRLEEILRSEALGSDAMAMDEIVGMLTALAMGPPMVQPSGWLPKVWGPGAEFESQHQAREASGLLLRMWNAACGLTTADDYEGQLDRLAGLPGQGTIRGYCRGFLEGVDFDRRGWERELAAAGLEEGLDLVGRLAGEPEDTGADTGSVAAEPDRTSQGPAAEGPAADEPAGHWRHREELCGWLQAAHETFRAARRLEAEQLDPAAPRTYERSRPKIGRNDPCPCGSGKKYKRCCIDADPPPWETAGGAAPWETVAGGAGAPETVGGGAATSRPSADRASSPASPPTPPEPSAESSGRPSDDEDPREIVERLMDRMLSGEWEDHFTGVVSRHLDAAASLLETVYDDEEPELLEGEVGSGLYMWALEDFLGHTTDDDRNVVDEYLEQHGAREPERDRAYLEGLRDSIPGLYEVVSATPGERMVLEDLLWERPDIEVPERELSSRVEPSVRIACRLVELEDATYMGGAVLGLPDDWSEEVAESIDALIDEVFGAVAREGVVDDDPPEGPLQFAALRKGAFLFSSVWAARMLSPESPSPAFESS